MSDANSAWALFTRLGEAQILLPAMLFALAWLSLAARARGPALWWLVGTGVVAVLTTISKVAFFGFEIGYAPLNFTGVSGHAMFAAAVLPVLTTLAGGGTAPQRRAIAALAGYALATLIAYSRIRVGAHSASEALAGLALGGAASALVLYFKHLPPAHPPRWLGVVLSVWLLSVPVGAPPSPTHGWVVRLSLALSDRPAPYTRGQMHRDHRRALQRQRSLAQAAAAR